MKLELIEQYLRQGCIFFCLTPPGLIVGNAFLVALGFWENLTWG